jgi:phosphopantetheinyl transferase
MPLLECHSSPLWGIWKIDETWEELLRQLDRQDEYSVMLDRFTSDSRKSEWLAVRLLLRQLLGCETTIAYHDTTVPYLPDCPYHISISHTKGYAAVLLGEQPVGIDIEYRSSRINRIKSRFMNEEELTRLGELDTEQLLICWSAKETAFKMMQERVVDLQTDLHVVSFDYAGRNDFLSIKESFTSASAIYRIKYIITPAFILTYSI